MSSLFIKRDINLTLLFFIPCVSLISWANVYLGNFNYDFGNYLLTFLFPSLLLACLLCLLTRSSFAKGFTPTLAKTLTTCIFAFILLYFILTSVLGFFGLNSETIFLTVKLQSPVDYSNTSGVTINPCPDPGTGNFGPLCQLTPASPREQANVIYFGELVLSLILLTGSYWFSDHIFRTKKKK